MRALVTGASGHVGANLVRDLLAQEWTVVPLVRQSSSLRGLAGLGLSPAFGDSLDGASVEAAARGCDVVFHAGTPYRTWARDPEEIRRPAIEGTETVLRAAHRAGVARVVYTSSCNAVGFTKDAAHPPDESVWAEGTRSVYVRAKLDAERRAWEVARELGLLMVAICPTTVLGALDFRVTPTTQGFLDMVRGKSPIPCAMNLVDVRDVARAHVLAAERGTSGQRYLAGGDNVPPDQLASLFEKHAGKRPKIGLPPLWLLKTVAVVAETVARLGGPAPFITRDLIADIDGRSPVFDCTRARTELGLSPRPAEEVVIETLRWLAFLGRLDAKLAAKFPQDPSCPS